MRSRIIFILIFLAVLLTTSSLFPQYIQESKTETPADSLLILSSGKGNNALAAQIPGYYWFREGLNILNQTGEDQKIHKKWPEVYKPEQIDIAMLIKYAVGILAPLLLLLAGSFLWSWMLRAKVNQKIKELQKNAQELREKNQFIESLVNLTPDILYIYDIIENKNIYTNDGIERILGFTPEEMKGMGSSIMEHLVHPDDFTEYHGKSLPAYLILKDNELFSHKFRMKHKNGEWRWLNSSELIFSRQPDGKPRQVFGVAHDITKEKLWEEKIQKSLQEKEILLKEVHHRVKNNMAVISSFIELQSATTDNELVKQLLGESKQRIRTMALVHEKLYKSSDFISIDVKNYITELVHDILYSYKNIPKKITTRIEIIELTLNLDTLMPIGLIINEIVTNSLKHAFNGTENPEIEILISKDENNFIKLVVSDNGKGLPDDEILTQKKSLGLMVINGLIEQINGKKQINRNNGTRYDIIFPVAKQRK